MISSSLAIKAGAKAAAARAGHLLASGKVPVPQAATQGLTSTGISLADLKAQRRQQANEVQPPSQADTSSAWDEWLPNGWDAEVNAAMEPVPELATATDPGDVAASLDDIVAEPPPELDAVPQNPLEQYMSNSEHDAADTLTTAGRESTEQAALEQQLLGLLQEPGRATSPEAPPMPQVEEQASLEAEDIENTITWDEITNLLRGMLTSGDGEAPEAGVEADEDGVFSQARDAANNLLADLEARNQEPPQERTPTSHLSPQAAASPASGSTLPGPREPAQPSATPKAPMTPAKRKPMTGLRLVKEELRDDEPMRSPTPGLPWARAVGSEQGQQADLWSSMPDFLDAAGVTEEAVPTSEMPPEPRKPFKLPPSGKRVLKLKPAPSWLPPDAVLPGMYAPTTPGVPGFRAVKKELDAKGVKKELDAFGTPSGSFGSCGSQPPAKDWEVRRDSRRKEAFFRDVSCKAICQIKHGLRQSDAYEEMPFKPKDWEKTFQPLLGDYLKFVLSRPDQFEIVTVPGAPPEVFLIQNVAGNATVVAPAWRSWSQVKQEERRGVKTEGHRGEHRQGPYSTSGSVPWRGACKDEWKRQGSPMAAKDEKQTWGRANKWDNRSRVGRPTWLDEISKPLPPMKPVRTVSAAASEPPKSEASTTSSEPKAGLEPRSSQIDEAPPSTLLHEAGQSDGESDCADLPFVIDSVGDLQPEAGAQAAEADPEALAAHLGDPNTLSFHGENPPTMEDASDDGGDSPLPFVIDVGGASATAPGGAPGAGNSSQSSGEKKKDNDLNVWSLIMPS